MMKHSEKVARVQAEVRRFYKELKPFRIFHGSTNSTRIQCFDKQTTIDTSFLDEVLTIDSDNLYATVEPNVPMDKLVKATLKHGLIPAVVMEFPGITVGGGIAGVAGESSSFKYGVFAQICDEIEMITPDGKLLNASSTRNSDLYDMSRGTYGTLGVITKVKLRLIPAKRYVNLTYLPVESFDQAIQTIMEKSIDENDFVDSIMFSKTSGTVIVGKLGDKKIGKTRRYSRAIDQWYYLDAQRNCHDVVQQTVPLVDYLFRYERGGFWVGRYAFQLFDKPFNRFTRFLLNPLMHTRKMYEALQASGASQQFLVQDLGLPANKAVEFMDFIDNKMDVYPIWLCPLNPKSDRSDFQLYNMPAPACINIGVWGNRIEDYDEFIRLNRILEQKLRKLKGKKWFYAHAYYPEKEFWQIYDRRKYDTIRKKYNASHLPSVFDKVVVHKRYPVDFHKGVWRAIFGQAKLKIK